MKAKIEKENSESMLNEEKLVSNEGQQWEVIEIITETQEIIVVKKNNFFLKNSKVAHSAPKMHPL